MKKMVPLFFVMIVLVFGINSGCGSVSSTPVAPTISVIPTVSPVMPTLTPQGKQIIVTSAADSGSGTLRQALQDAQSGDIITFDPIVFPPSDPTKIALTSGLPEINQGSLTIDASNAGVIIDGSSINTPDPQHGISIVSDHNTIRGLQIAGFSDAGIGLYGGAQYNLIGGDSRIGDGRLGQGNLISGNGNFGIALWNEGTSHNIIQGNYIGIDIDGTSIRGHARDGIHLNGANHNMITSNLIGGNDTGVYLCCVENGGNIITNNFIGTDQGGANLFGNHSAGILVDRTSYNIIGPSNIIAYNTGPGIMLWEDTLFNTITQNSIRDNIGEGISITSEVMNDSQPVPPVIFDFDLQAGSVEGWACANCRIEIFSDNGDEGAIFEGQVLADNTGAFIFTKGGVFIGPRLTLTATDAGGNTSVFSQAMSGSAQSLTLQVSNHLLKTPLNPRRSQELEDNHIGTFFEDYVRYRNTESVYALGYKWMRLLSLTEWGALNEAGVWQENLPVTVEAIPPDVDAKITEYADNNITIVLNLSAGAGLDINTPFTTEEQVNQYLQYVRMVVRHFKGRIGYYEIWNEPTGKITVEDYVHLIERAVPVIKEEDPEAKIAIGAFAGFWQTGYPGYGAYYRYYFDLDYMLDVLRSGVVPLIDVISWHPFNGHIPDDPYYQNYPEMVNRIKSVAISEGFTGEYLAEELFWTIAVDGNWPAPDEKWPEGLPVSPLVAAKLYARAIVDHRGLGVTVAINDFFLGDMTYVIHNLNDTFSGAMPAELAMIIESQPLNIMSYSFSLPNGDYLVALWTNGEAVENDPGVIATLKLPDFSAAEVAGIDIMYGYAQQLIVDSEDGCLVVPDLLVKDYPIILHITNIISEAAR